MKEYPESVNILGCRYSIEYVDRPSDVDIFKRKSLWGQIDYWTRTIRVYANDRCAEDVWETIIHEVIHGIASALNIDRLEGSDAEDDVDILSVALTDTLVRNGWMKIGESDS